jgi:hypothetical protein
VDPCAEFSNKCPANKEPGGKQKTTPRTKDGKPTHNPTNGNPTTKQPTTHQPTTHQPTTKQPAFKWGPKINRPNCGKDCMIPGNEPLDKIDPVEVIVVGIADVAVLVGVAVEEMAGTITTVFIGVGITITTTITATTTTSNVVESNGPEETKPDTSREPPQSRTFDCGPNSFVSGTQVLMADRGTKPIEDVKIGDWVIAADPATGRTESRPVTALIAGQGVKQLVTLVIDIDGEHGGKAGLITATDNHPFWIPELRLWLPAEQLKPGMWLQTASGTYVQVAEVKPWTAIQKVHNLTVDDLHTYYVLAGATPILVHNTGPCPEDVYRSDTRHASEIFEKGFEPRGNNMDVAEHASGISRDSGFVSTSKSESVATGRGGNIYTIRGKSGVDVNKEFPGNPFAHEQEIAIPGRVDTCYIVGCRPPGGGWMPNPNFTG